MVHLRNTPSLPRDLSRPLSSAVLALLLLGMPAPAVQALDTPEVDPALAIRLQARLDEWRENHRAPGVAAAVRFPDDSLWLGSSGRSQVGPKPRTVRPRTPFAIASITKSFMAALVLQLQERGRLSLKDPISRWLPGYPNGDAITIRMLLNHRSGIFNYFEHPDYERLVFDRPRHHWKLRQILQLRGPTYFEPGKGHHYSNTNYVLLGKIVTKVTGRSPALLIRRRFLEPLGMSDTFFQGEELVERWPAKGYWTRSGGGYIGFSDGTRLRPNTSAATVAWTAGALVSSARDLATWAHALFEGDILSPESFAEMLSFHPRTGYGLGMRKAILAGVEGYGHGGSLRGFVSGMYRLPEHDIDIVILVNLGNVSTGALLDGLARIAIDAFPLPEPEAGDDWFGLDGWLGVGDQLGETSERPRTPPVEVPYLAAVVTRR